MSADPGGVFASDDHRRVLGSLRPPYLDGDGHSLGALVDHVATDPYTFGEGHPDEEEVLDVLKDLEADGHAQHTAKHGWRMTKKGFNALTGPNGNAPEA